jgi:DNA-binding response OmpR family regulator
MKKILIAEDENLIRSSLTQALRKDGFLVVEAKDYREALERLKEETCDLAVVDLYLEDGMHGLALIKEVHRLSPSAKVIVITAFGTEEIKEAVMKEGIDRFYDKPFEIADIKNAVRGLLQRTGALENSSAG